MKTCIKFLFAVCVTSAAFGQGTILWDESVNGNLSEDSLTPTFLPSLGEGTNSLAGVSELVPSPPIWISHPNIFTITVPSGLAVQAIYLQVDKPKLWAWIGDTGFSTEMAFIRNPLNGELLAQLGLAMIPAGTYGMYLENHDAQAATSIANFRLNFVVQPIPEPSTLALALAGAAGFVGLRGWRKRREKQV